MDTLSSQYRDILQGLGEDPEREGLREGPLGALYLAYVRDPDGHKLCALYRPK